MEKINLEDLATLRLKIKRHNWKMDEFIKLANEQKEFVNQFFKDLDKLERGEKISKPRKRNPFEVTVE
tara:strand:- start:194 stop:397 length:204 start_codon:yes stop_codon:yes gene_type:complete